MPRPAVVVPVPAHAPVRVAVLDDHPVVRAGLEAVLTAAPGLTYVGGAADEHALWPLLHRTRPDVVLLDLHHPGRNGLTLAALVARAPNAPRVVLHPAVPSDAVTLAAALAGAVATVGKSAPALELAGVLRAAATQAGPASVGARARRTLLADLDHADRALVAMRLAGTSAVDIAAVLDSTPGSVRRRLDTLLARFAGLAAPGPGGPPAPLLGVGRPVDAARRVGAR